MRLAVLVGFVVAAAVLAVVVLARRDADEGDGPMPWAQQASSVCERGLAKARAVVAASDGIPDAEERVLHLYAGATRVEAGVLADLEALPRPSADAPRILRVLRTLSESHEADVAAVASLEDRFDRALLQQRVAETVPVAADLRDRFLALGADGCARYLNPVSYG